MSETVHYKGKLGRVEFLENEDLEGLCERILKGDKGDHCDTFAEYLEEFEQFVIIKDRVFKVLEKIEADSESIFNISTNDNAVFDFEVMYYNGGCCFGEALEYAFDLKEKESND